jgi:2-polyprenyl-3-methyl-5-hydroxy-6-metoxy-1,4-benzoquinol methylase
MYYRDEVARFDRLYLLHDPWSMRCEREAHRFSETNRLIAKNFNRPNALLEIGCGEGLQSRELQLICERLYGIDVSRRAVRRAERRCPQAQFGVGNIFHMPSSIPPIRFDLVTACEVLYYMADIPVALKRISGLGRQCLVSYYDGVSEKLNAYVAGIPGVQFEIVSYNDFSWTFAWWRT